MYPHTAIVIGDGDGDRVSIKTHGKGLFYAVFKV